MGIEFIATLAFAGAGLAVTWGALLTRIKVLEAKNKEWAESRKVQGERIGRLERWRAFLEGRSAAKRPSRALPVLDEESDEESGPVDD